MTADAQRAAGPAKGGTAGGAAISQDSLLGGRVRIRQPVEGYRVAIDPVFLAAAVPAQAGESVLDLGCGVGAAALCLLARVPELRVTGLDLRIELVRLADDNARANGVGGRFLAVAGDLVRPPPRLAPSSFHHVLCNPPHLPAESTRPARSRARDTANREGEARLSDWVAGALTMVRSGGSVAFVHRADRLDDLLGALSSRAGEIVVFPLWPGPNKPAKRVLVRARKEVATPLRLSPGLVLHEEGGGFTRAAQAVLRDGAALTL